MNSGFLKISKLSFVGICRQLQFRNYKSIYNLESLYPSSKPELDTKAYIEQKISASDGKFAGYIPQDDLKISYSCSSGPGGQNINKVNTKVEIRFHVPSATWIPEAVKNAFLKKEANRINRDGYFIVTSEKTRKQMLNQADCIDKIRTSLFSCNEYKYEPSEDELAMIKARRDKAKASILVDKRRHSLKKQSRAVPNNV